MRNVYVHDPKVIDIAKVREEAQRKADGDGRNAPVGTTIHFHKQSEPCNDREHEEVNP